MCSRQNILRNICSLKITHMILVSARVLQSRLFHLNCWPVCFKFCISMFISELFNQLCVCIFYHSFTSLKWDSLQQGISHFQRRLSMSSFHLRHKMISLQLCRLVSVVNFEITVYLYTHAAFKKLISVLIIILPQCHIHEYQQFKLIYYLNRPVNNTLSALAAKCKCSKSQLLQCYLIFIYSLVREGAFS